MKTVIFKVNIVDDLHSSSESSFEGEYSRKEIAMIIMQLQSHIDYLGNIAGIGKKDTEALDRIRELSERVEMK